MNKRKRKKWVKNNAVELFINEFLSLDPCGLEYADRVLYNFCMGKPDEARDVIRRMQGLEPRRRRYAKR